jgi:ribosomal protein S18 acetylase RimI-like enzyme
MALVCTTLKSFDVSYMQIVVAQPEDIPAWLHLASEVESLFGPMVHEPSFHHTLRNSITRGTAFCIREADGPAGAALLGGLLFSAKPPIYKIRWLAVANEYRRRRIGQCLVEYAINLVQPPAELLVITFGADIQAGQPARHFYERLGFIAAEQAPRGPEGGSRQVFRRRCA